MFWIGAAPVEPGMPLSASMPASPSATARSTTASHDSPASMRSTMEPSAGGSSPSGRRGGSAAGRVRMPWVATLSTVPRKGSDDAIVLEPPPSSSSDSGSSASASA